MCLGNESNVVYMAYVLGHVWVYIYIYGDGGVYICKVWSVLVFDT